MQRITARCLRLPCAQRPLVCTLKARPLPPRTRLVSAPAASAAPTSTTATATAGLQDEVSQGLLLSKADLEFVARDPQLVASWPHAVSRIQPNCEALLQLYTPSLVAKLVRRHPQLLAGNLPDLIKLFLGFGLDADACYKLMKYSPGLFDAANTAFSVGAAITFLRGWSFTSEDIVTRIMACYPQVLSLSLESLESTVTFLRSKNYSEDAVRNTLVSCPQLLCPKTSAKLFPILERIRLSRDNKYVQGGSYWI